MRKQRKRSIFSFQKDQTVVFDDSFAFNLILRNTRTKKIIDDLKQRSTPLLFPDTFDELCLDIFYSFYLKDLKLRPKEYIRLKYLFNNHIVTRLVKTGSHGKFRQGAYSTIHDKDASFNAFQISIEEILRNIQKSLSDEEKTEINKLSDSMQTLEDKYEQKKTKGTKESKELAWEKETEENKLREKFQGVIEKMDDRIKKAIEDGINQARETMDYSQQVLNNLFKGYGRGFEKGEIQDIPIHKRIELAKLLSKQDKLKQIVNLLGRFRIISQEKQVEKQSEAKIEPDDIKRGGNIQDVPPTELAELSGNRVTKARFFEKWAKKELSQVERKPIKQTENVGKGSIIICLDTSGSMAGEKELKAKALALSVAEVAYEQNRNFACILYSSQYDPPIVIEIKPTESLSQIADKVIDLSQKFYGGGTVFELPLQEAIKIIDKDEFNNGDILFLTDGYADVSQTFLNEYKAVKAKKQFKTIGLLVDSSDADRDNGKRILEKFCDEIKYNSQIEKDLDFSKADDFAASIFLSL
jgi:uncharacterized protein with von Willebrand factor type A (vWA) domain